MALLLQALGCSYGLHQGLGNLHAIALYDTVANEQRILVVPRKAPREQFCLRYLPQDELNHFPEVLTESAKTDSRLNILLLAYFRADVFYP